MGFRAPILQVEGDPMRNLTPFAKAFAVALGVSALLPGTRGEATPAAVAGDPEHGGALVEARCAACHGPDGNGGQATVPRLAGQDFVYLYRQLLAFKHGVRASPVMEAIASAMSERDMRDASAFLAGQARRGGQAGDAGLEAEGRTLFLQGSTDGRVPACAGCHDASQGWFAGGMRGMPGMRGAGGMPMMRMSGRNGPRLLGQRAAYVQQRLRSFAHGTPAAGPMSAVAASMSARQMRAVAAYIAAHP